MMRSLLILRPQPGADATAERVRALGLEAIVAPLFRIVPRPWTWPENVESLLVTSANAARSIGVAPDRRLPVYAVGNATAEALSAAGFGNLTVGHQGVAEIVARARRDGVQSMLHLAGEDVTWFDPGAIRIEARNIYAAEPCGPDSSLGAALAEGAVALLHSARAARRFRELAGTGHRIAAISSVVLTAAGDGWERTAVAEDPADDALLAAAAQLCQ